MTESGILEIRHGYSQIIINFTISINNTMHKKTRSLLEELDSMCPDKDRDLLVENRALNVISSAIRLIELIESNYSPEQSEILVRKLFNAIRSKEPSRFTKSIRKSIADQSDS